MASPSYVTMFSFTFGCSLAYSCTNGSLVESVQTVMAEPATCVASLKADELAEAVVAGATLAQPARAMAATAAASGGEGGAPSAAAPR